MIDRRDYMALIRGERRGPLAGLARAFLRLASWGFGLVVALRRLAYALGLVRVRRAGLPVISVGNLTAGGTGKTPLAIELARRLVEKGERPAVIARGYGAATDGALNDELMLVKARVPGAIVVAGADRVLACARAVEAGATCAVLDDGFQHWRLARDLDVVVIDATDPFGQGALLPRGLLREGPAALARAHAVVLTRVELAGKEAVAALRERLAALGVRETSVLALAPSRLVKLDRSAEEAPAALAGAKVVALSGIGRPDAFRATLEGLGARVVAERAFPDHHPYGCPDVDDVLALAEREGARVVTTEKDAVKLAALDLGARAARLSALALDGRLEPEGALFALALAALARARTEHDRGRTRATSVNETARGALAPAGLAVP